MPDFNELKQKLCFVRDMKLRATRRGRFIDR